MQPYIMYHWPAFVASRFLKSVYALKCSVYWPSPCIDVLTFMIYNCMHLHACICMHAFACMQLHPIVCCSADEWILGLLVVCCKDYYASVGGAHQRHTIVVVCVCEWVLDGCCQQSRIQQRTNPTQQAAYHHDSSICATNQTATRVKYGERDCQSSVYSPTTILIVCRQWRQVGKCAGIIMV